MFRKRRAERQTTKRDHPHPTLSGSRLILSGPSTAQGLFLILSCTHKQGRGGPFISPFSLKTLPLHPQ